MIARSGNLLTSGAEMLVNAVNTTGVMGAGIALQFRRAYPAYYKAYRTACAQKQVRPGSVLVYETGLAVPRFIASVPTKRDWRDPSRLEDVRDGLAGLRLVIEEREPWSVAIPALGCGNGGLAWEDVRPLIRHALAGLRNVRIYVYLPGDPR